MATPAPAPTPAPSAAALTAPSVTATAVDMTPEKGFFKAMWSKVVDVYTSTFKAGERLDRMNKMPSHQQEIVDAVTNWRQFSDKVDPAIQAHVKALGNSIGDLIEKSGDQFANAMKKLNSACEEITGFKVADLTPTHRRELSTEQRAKLARAYADMKAELGSSKTPYIEAANSVKEIGTVVSDLIGFDTIQRDALKVYDKEAYDKHVHSGAPNPPTQKSTFGSTDLLNPKLQAVAPDIDQKMEAIYSTARNNAFEALAQSEGVTTGSPDKLKEAIGAAKTALEGAGTFVSDVVKQATAMSEQFKKNEDTRNDVFSTAQTTDGNKIEVKVYESTFNALKAWFTTHSLAAENQVRGTFEAAQSQDEIKAWVDASANFTATSEQYHQTLQNVARAVAPLTPLLKQSETAPKLFQETVDYACLRIEELAVHFVTTLGHDEAKEKLEEITKISSKIGVKAAEDLASGGGMSQENSDLIKIAIDQALADLKKPTTKSWI